jgi:ubiquinone/menaquinone biosynthesis C-methylase UbiE
MKDKTKNVVIEDFGNEWEKFNQLNLDADDLLKYFNNYFAIFPWQLLNRSSVGFDLGCGSGRWASMVAPRVGELNCIDPSFKALNVAKKKLKNFSNINFLQNDASNIQLKDASQDFGYSLGVLHHIQDTQGALNNCVAKLKKGAPFLIYLYYKFDGRPIWFRFIWQVSNQLRIVICMLPFGIKIIVTNCIAAMIYYPIKILCKTLSIMKVNIKSIPLSQYKDSSFYTMKTDALDRFGTKLEKRFTKAEIFQMMEKSGLSKITFSSGMPYWVAVGYKL